MRNVDVVDRYGGTVIKYEWENVKRGLRFTNFYFPVGERIFRWFCSWRKTAHLPPLTHNTHAQTMTKYGMLGIIIHI